MKEQIEINEIPKNINLLKIKLLDDYFNKNNIKKENLSYKKIEVLKEIIITNISFNDFKKYNFNNFDMSDKEYIKQKELYFKKTFNKNLEINAGELLKKFEKKSKDYLINKLLNNKINYADLYYFRSNMNFFWIKILEKDIEKKENKNRNFNNVYEILNENQRSELKKIVIDYFANGEENDLIKVFNSYIKIKNVEYINLENANEEFKNKLKIEKCYETENPIILNFLSTYNEKIFLKLITLLMSKIIIIDYNIENLLEDITKNIQNIELILKNKKIKKVDLLEDLSFLYLIKEFIDSFINNNKTTYTETEYLENLKKINEEN